MRRRLHAGLVKLETIYEKILWVNYYEFNCAVTEKKKRKTKNFVWNKCTGKIFKNKREYCTDRLNKRRRSRLNLITVVSHTKHKCVLPWSLPRSFLSCSSSNFLFLTKLKSNKVLLRFPPSPQVAMTLYCVNLRDVAFRKSPNNSGDLLLSNLMQKNSQGSQSSIVPHSNFTHFKLRYQYLLFPFKFIFLSIGFTVVIPLVSCFRAKNQATSIESSRRIYQSSRWNAPVAGLFWQPCYAPQEQVENELDKLEKHGVIKKSNRSCWASWTVVTKGW